MLVETQPAQCVMQPAGDKPLEFKKAGAVEGMRCRRACIMQVRSIIQHAGSVGKASHFFFSRGVRFEFRSRHLLD